MLELRSKGVFSNSYFVLDNGAKVAELNRSTWRQRGEIVHQGRIHKLKVRGMMRRTFQLLDGEDLIVEARRPTTWRSRCVFEFQGRKFELVNRNWFSSALVVKAQGAEVGSIAFKGFVHPRVHIDMPDSLPLPVRVFVAWIAVLRRDESAAAAGAGSGGAA
jgi:hypothetical protein